MKVGEAQDNMPNPLADPKLRQELVFREGMIVQIEGIPMMSMGVKGNKAVFKIISEGNKDQCQRKFNKLMEQTKLAMAKKGASDAKLRSDIEKADKRAEKEAKEQDDN